MDSGDDAYILLLLSDGNLPTGAFVASAGLESFVTHGFLTSQETTKGKKNDTLNYVVDFVRDNLHSYARTALPFVSDAHISARQHIGLAAEIDDDSSTAALQDMQDLDDLYESMTLNHVARRASKTQGVALLSLYSKGFTKPPVLRTGDTSLSSPEDEARDSRIGALVDKIKLAVRREETHGHLPICWGVLTAALGLSLERSQFVHLFLYARGLLSAGVRMNTLGPYAAQQLLLHAIRPLVAAEAKQCATLRTGLKPSRTRETPSSQAFDEGILTHNGPAMTWPLGEIIAARHDLQHSRVFNS